MNTLIKYTKIFLTGMEEKFMRKILSTVEILIHPLTVLQLGVLFWVVVEIA